MRHCNDNEARRERNARNRGAFRRGLPDDFATERFWRHVEKTPDCWNWTGVLAGGGYGKFNFRYVGIQAHRVSFFLAGRVIPDGMVLDHLCRNRRCVRPDHLEAVTERENVHRGISPAAGNALKTHCPRGHEYTDFNTYVGFKGKRHCRTCERVRWSRKGTASRARRTA